MRRTLGLCLLLLAFFAMRLPSLRLLPLYSDEALGLWRAARVLEGSLTRGAGEGKPLHAWMIAAAIALPGDDIRGARAAHVVAGALLLVALWDVTRRQVSPAAGWTAAALWIVLPFGAIFERTVTPDVPLAAAGMAAAACAFRIVSPDRPESRRWRWLLLASGAAAMFVKMPVGLLPAALPLIVPLALPPAERAAARARLRTYTLALGAIVAILAAIVAVRAAIGAEPLGFGMHEFGRKMAVVREADNAPHAVVQNVGRVGEFAWLYLGPVGALLAVAGVVGACVARHRPLRLLSAFALTWAALFVFTARSLSAHYLLATVPFCVMAMAWAVTTASRALERRHQRTWVTAVAAGAIVLLVLATAWPLHRALWTDPASARFASTERLHYVEGEWSGYGLPEAAAWMDEMAAQGRGVPVFVAVHVADYERLRLYANEPTLRDLVQVQIDRRTLPLAQRMERARALAASGRRVLVVVGAEDTFNEGWRSAFPTAPVRAAFPKPGGDQSALVLEILPSSLAGR